MYRKLSCPYMFCPYDRNKYKIQEGMTEQVLCHELDFNLTIYTFIVNAIIHFNKK